MFQVPIPIKYRLFNGKYRGEYRFDSIQLSKIPEEVNISFSGKVFEKIDAVSSIDESALPIRVTPSTKKLYPRWDVQLKRDPEDPSGHGQLLVLSSRAQDIGKAMIPPLNLDFDIPLENLDLSLWAKLLTLLNDLVHLSVSSEDLALFLSIIATVVWYLILAYLFNFFYLGIEIAVIGLPVYLIGKMAKVDLFLSLIHI